MQLGGDALALPLLADHQVRVLTRRVEFGGRGVAGRTRGRRFTCRGFFKDGQQRADAAIAIENGMLVKQYRDGVSAARAQVGVK